MKNLLLALLTLSPISFAAEEKKAPPQPIVVSSPKALATWDQEKQEFKYEKGAQPEEVAKTLMLELLAKHNQLQQCVQELEKSKKPGKK